MTSKNKKSAKKINVMHIVADLGFGGMQNQLRIITLGMNPEKYNVSVCCLREAGHFAEKIRAAGIPVHVLGKSRKVDLSLIFKLRRLMRENSIDIVHTHNWTANLWGRLGAIAAGVKHIIAYEINIGRGRGRLHHLIDHLLSRFTTYIAANSEACRDEFLIPKERIPVEKIKIVHSAVEMPTGLKEHDRAALRRRYGLPPDAFVAGTVSRLDRVKGHEYLIRAARDINDSGRRAYFLIAGEDETMMPELVALVKEYNLTEYVRFIGWVTDVSRVYPILDAFVLPSLTESLPVSIIEAMSFGVPVVASRVGGIPELIVDGATGFLTPPADASALAEKISALIDDAELRERFSEEALRRARECFTAEKMVREFEALYCGMMS